ncbi:MAG: phosphatase PAP2 family protein [Bacteriovorax sp.]|jgi:membrane-associated phospholipid phosphatase
MKPLIAIGLSLILTANAFGTELNLDYGSMIKQVKACRTSVFGCTAEQEIEIAKFNGQILSAYDLNGYLAQDTQKSIFIPLELTNAELLTLAAATSLGVVAFNNDQEIMDVVQRNKTQTTEVIQNVGNFLGTGTAAMGIAAGSYFLGVYYKDNRLKKVGLFIVGAELAQGIITTAVKHTLNRVRPNEDRGPYNFFEAGKNSFYSGHTATAFSLATVVAEMYKEDYPIVPWVAYGIASVTAYARVHDKAHWASDVIIGAVAGHLITKLALSIMDKKDDGRGGLMIYPSIDPKSGTYMIYAEWTGRQHEAPLKCAKMPEGMAKVDACLAEAFAKAGK